MRYLNQWCLGYRRMYASLGLNELIKNETCAAPRRPQFGALDCSCRTTLRWRHNGCDCVWNHQPHDCLLNRLFRRRSKKISKLRVTGLCAGNSPGPENSPHKGPVTRKMFPFDDVIMNLCHRHKMCVLYLYTGLFLRWMPAEIFGALLSL